MTKRISNPSVLYVGLDVHKESIAVAYCADDGCGNPSGQNYLQKIDRKHGKAKALTILAHRLARDVYHMLIRQEAFDMKKFLNG